MCGNVRYNRGTGLWSCTVGGETIASGSKHDLEQVMDLWENSTSGGECMTKTWEAGDKCWLAVAPGGHPELNGLETPERETQAEAAQDLWAFLTEMPPEERDVMLRVCYVQEFTVLDLHDDGRISSAASTDRRVTPRDLEWFHE
jgi:hypothetical protein